jgi:hypothetical protein
MRKKQFDLNAILRAHKISCEESRSLIMQSKLCVQSTGKLLNRCAMIAFKAKGGRAAGRST